MMTRMFMVIALLMLATATSAQVPLAEVVKMKKDFGISDAEIVRAIKSRGGLDCQAMNKADVYLQLRQSGFSAAAIAQLLDASCVGRPQLPKLPVYIKREYRPTQASGPKEIWALAVGVNKYVDSKHLPDLNFAEADAEDFAIRLVQIGVPPEQVAVLTGEKVTPDNIRKLAREILKASGNVYLFFSGHGLANNKEFYLGCQTTLVKKVIATAYPMSDLKGLLVKMRSKRAIVLLDACHSGAGKAEVNFDEEEYDADSGPLRSGNLHQQQHDRIKELPKEKEIAIITSCRAGQISREGGKGHGIFTEFVLQGLQGEADENKDGTVKIEELMWYVKRQVYNKSTRQQEPDCSYSRAWNDKADPGLPTSAQVKAAEWKLRGAYLIDGKGNKGRSFPVGSELYVKIGWLVDQVRSECHEELIVEGAGLQRQQQKFSAPATTGAWSHKLPLRWQQPQAGTHPIKVTVRVGEEQHSLELAVQLTEPQLQAADLQLQLSGPDQVRPGSSGDYRMRLSNNGRIAARELYLELTIPAGLAYRDDSSGKRLRWPIELGAGQNKNFDCRLEAKQAGSYRLQARAILAGSELRSSELTVTVPQQSQVKERSADGRYEVSQEGVITDTKTGLQWYVGPDRYTNWNQAKSWAENLTVAGGGWRLPSTKELEGIYETNKESNIDKVFRSGNTYIFVWSNETKGSSSAWDFNFYGGDRYWDARANSTATRGFAARSGRR